MCTYQTQRIAVSASAKMTRGWTPVTDATIYFDHPVHFPADHALMIDVANPALGPDARVALEMDATSARALALTILDALAALPAGML